MFRTLSIIDYYFLSYIRFCYLPRSMIYYTVVEWYSALVQSLECMVFEGCSRLIGSILPWLTFSVKFVSMNYCILSFSL